MESLVELSSYRVKIVLEAIWHVQHGILSERLQPAVWFVGEVIEAQIRACRTRPNKNGFIIL